MGNLKQLKVGLFVAIAFAFFFGAMLVLFIIRKHFLMYVVAPGAVYLVRWRYVFVATEMVSIGGMRACVAYIEQIRHRGHPGEFQEIARASPSGESFHPKAPYHTDRKALPDVR